MSTINTPAYNNNKYLSHSKLPNTKCFDSRNRGIVFKEIMEIISMLFYFAGIFMFMFTLMTIFA